MFCLAPLRKGDIDGKDHLIACPRVVSPADWPIERGEHPVPRILLKNADLLPAVRNLLHMSRRSKFPSFLGFLLEAFFPTHPARSTSDSPAARRGAPLIR